MNILNFNEWQEAMKIGEEQKQIIDSIDESVEFELILEGLKSGILKSIFSARFGAITYGRSKSFKRMAEDFYDKYKVDLNSIQDSDFEVMRSPNKSETKGLFKDSGKLCFWINDDPKFVRSYLGRQGKTISSPALILVTKGPNALVSGFNKNSDFSRYKKDPLGFVGANKWEKEEYSFTGLPVTSTSKAAYHEMTTTLYTLNIPELQEKYSTEGKRKSRAEARSGAVAIMSNKDIKAENLARYKEISSRKLDPKSIMSNIEACMKEALELYKSTFTDLQDPSSVENIRIELDKGYFGKSIPDTMQAISYLARDYAQDFIEFTKLSKGAEAISAFIETGKMPKDQKKLDSYYVDSALSKPERAPDILSRIQDRLKDSTLKLVPHKQKAESYLAAIRGLKK